MLRSKQPILIDALNQITDVVYTRAVRKSDNEDAGLVTFDTEFFVLHKPTRIEKVNVKTGTKKEQVMDDSSGTPEPTGETIDVDQFEVQEKTVCRPQLALFHSRKAKYKSDRFYETIGNPTPQEFDDYYLSEIDKLNGLDWTGRELDKISVFGLSSSDFEIVSDDELTSLLTPYLVD